MIYMKLLLGSVVLARAAASTVCTEQFSDEAKLAYCEGLAAGKWGFNRLQEHFWYKHADEVEACFGDDVTEFQGGTVPDCAAITSTRKLSHTDGKAAEKLMNNLMPRLRATGQKHRETEQRRRLGTDDFVKAEGNGYATCEDSKNFYDVTSGVFENAEELFLATTSGPNGYCRDSCIRDVSQRSVCQPSVRSDGQRVMALTLTALLSPPSPSRRISTIAASRPAWAGLGSGSSTSFRRLLLATATSTAMPSTTAASTSAKSALV